MIWLDVPESYGPPGSGICSERQSYYRQAIQVMDRALRKDATVTDH